MTVINTPPLRYNHGRGAVGRMTEHGWLSRIGVLLNSQCPRCGVWISTRRYEFDGARHGCGQKPVSLDADQIERAMRAAP